MEAQIWNQPLEIKIGNALQSTTLIRSTREAAQTLLEDWPVRRGDAYKKAIISCSRTLRGDAPSSLARNSVIAAAREAGVAVIDQPLDIEHFEVEIAQVCLDLAREMAMGGSA